jgi:DNA polymerase-3 subunit delta'
MGAFLSKEIGRQPACPQCILTFMFFSDLIGNDRVKKQLALMAAKRTVGNSLLFTGPDGIGKGMFAYSLAKSLLCQNDRESAHGQKIDHHTHPDIRIYKPEGKTGMHSIQAMRQFSSEVYLPPYEASSKVLIIHEADRMLPYSANALLKPFEEPALTSVIILLSSNPSAILPTILSRCRVIYFAPIAPEEIVEFLHSKHGVDRTEAIEIAFHAKGSLATALHLLQKKERVAATDPLLLDLLAKGRGRPYKELTKAVEQLGESIDLIKQESETAAKEELLRAMPDELSAVQQQALEKEVEGAVSIRYLQEVNRLLEATLGWYRDMQLLSFKGDPNYLIHRSHQPQLEQALQRGELRPLEEIQKAIAATKLAVERSTPFTTAFETLLLKLV